MLLQKWSVIISFCFTMSFTMSFAETDPAQTLNKAKQFTNQTHQESKNSQNKINQWDDETQTMLNQYRDTLKRTENLKIYNEQLASYVKLQKEEMLDIRRKIEQVKNTSREVVPLMLRMLESLNQFIELDIPFLPAKRKKRVHDLREALSRSDVSVSEKYRQLISVYKLEQEYGGTLQSYRELREIDGKELTVDYVRLGRLAFLYISLDGRHMGYWSKKERQWKTLPGSYKKSVLKAVKVAKKHVPPDLIRLPVFLSVSSAVKD